MTWINTIAYDDTTGKLKTLYDRVKGPDNNVDNIMMAHSLRPHTMEAHMTIYKYVLHHSANTLPKHFLEAIGTYVSMLNQCHYCIDHHYAGMARLLNNQTRASKIRKALDNGKPEQAFDQKHTYMLNYEKKLTLCPSAVSLNDIESMQKQGITDGEILEVNQVTAYFCYANRTVLGLGINTDGDLIGLSPNNSDNPDDWNHS